ncbi:MAG: hypothetical protein V1790_13275 [Planctomycetota bacterium]
MLPRRTATDKLTRQKRLMLSPAEEKAVNALVTRIADGLGTTLRLSHLVRACLVIMHHAEPQILERAASTKLTRPPNEMADVLGDFERRLARLLLVSFKDSGKIE